MAGLFVLSGTVGAAFSTPPANTHKLFFISPMFSDEAGTPRAIHLSQYVY
jgi:hypothetical protein